MTPGRFHAHVCGEMFTNALISSVCDFSGISLDQTASHRCDFVVALQGGGWRALTGRHDGHWARNDPHMCVVGCVGSGLRGKPSGCAVISCKSVRFRARPTGRGAFRAIPRKSVRALKGRVGRSSWHAWVLDCMESPMAVRLFRASPCGSVRAPRGGVRSVQFRASPCVHSRGVSGVVLGTQKGSLSCV